MKKILFAALAATVLFASCAKENNENAGSEGKSAKLTIGIADPSESRAVGAKPYTDNTDNAISEFKAFVFAGETLQAVITSTDGTPATNNTDVTTAATVAYVITNANSHASLSGLAKGGITKTNFLKLTANLLSGTAPAGVPVLGAGSKVYGSGIIPLTQADFVLNGTNYEASKSVAAVPVPARISVTVTDSRDNKADAAAYVLSNVQLLNVAGTSCFIAPAAEATTTWYGGIAGSKLCTVQNYFNDAFNASGNWFYVHENSDETQPTILTIAAIYNGNTRHYPIHFATTDVGVLERGKNYEVAVTITGDAKDPDQGVEDPEKPIVTASLQVTVTVQTWVQKTIIKNF